MAAITAFDSFDLSDLEDIFDLLGQVQVTARTATTWSLQVGQIGLTISGVSLHYDFLGVPDAGSITGLSLSIAGQTAFGITDFTLPVSTLLDFAFGDVGLEAFDGIFSGADVFTGGAFGDLFEGLGGADVMHGGAGGDTLEGGAGLDYLRGDEGNDSLSGGEAFDDLQGNMGDDTVAGGAGDDWVVGGKDNDLLSGDDGHDVVLGNLGRDTLAGGAGADVVRGGQQDDVLNGGAGDDWLSGDRDNDTLTGGAGADTFNVFAEAGRDRVTDFNVAEGDRIRVEGGHWTAAQVGADTVVTVDGQAQLTLAGVQLSTLGSGWIFGA